MVWREEALCKGSERFGKRTTAADADEQHKRGCQHHDGERAREVMLWRTKPTLKLFLRCVGRCDQVAIDLGLCPGLNGFTLRMPTSVLAMCCRRGMTLTMQPARQRAAYSDQRD